MTARCIETCAARSSCCPDPQPLTNALFTHPCLPKPESTSNLHVIFGAGPLGKWTARTLVAMGQHVRMINRSGVATRVPAGVEMRKSDAYDIAANIDLLRGAHAVYQCAQPEYYAWPEHFPRLQAAILEAACKSGARFVAAGKSLHVWRHTRRNDARRHATQCTYAQRSRAAGDERGAVRSAPAR